LATEVAEAMGRVPILATDGPGFIVNRCGRPFYTEGLRLLTERVATHAEIDRICRLGGGFRMGPFELMDLVGIDVGFEVAKSFMELSFGEPRWKPSPIQAKLVAAGRLGRKSGMGYYDYSGESYRDEDGEVEPADAPAVAIAGDDPGAGRLREVVARGGELEAELVSCATQSLAKQKQPGAIGFVLLPGSGLIELIKGPEARGMDAAERLARAAGLHHQWINDAPGGVLGRVLACNVNEALFAVGEGVGSREDIDTGLKLGLNHPHGPLEWGDILGIDLVRDVLDGVWQERREERYRPAPLLA
jgi:3-hydroxybutyryl-CoA dehydrogenase